MHKAYDLWPEIATKQYEAGLDGIDFEKTSHVVFAGMGGSGAISDIFSAILSKTDIHVDVVKGYQLPKTVDSDSLVVTTSVSGNTEETLNVLNSASELKCKIIAFSNGGKMQKYCINRGLKHRNVPMTHSPRASFPSFLFSMIRVLEQFLPIEKNDVIDSLEKLRKQKEKISSHNLNDENPAISLAKQIEDIPLVYYPLGLQAAAIRFKNSLQENVKMHVITENIIEASHNGICAWEQPSNIKPFLIQGKDDHFKTKERCEIMKKFFIEKNITFSQIHSVEGSILSKLINLIYLLDYATIYRAVLFERDPTPVNSIDYIKEQLLNNKNNSKF